MEKFRFTQLKFKIKLALLSSIVAVTAFSISLAGEPPIIQPGAPGKSSKELDAEQAIKIAVSSYSPDDIKFLQDMIPHHNQAVQMSALVAKRTNRQELIDVAGRIDASQKDEMEFMQGWLLERDIEAPDPDNHDAMHVSHKMAGMASAKQMKALAAASATDFDRLFLELMIAHHKGAVDMVEHLLEQPGSAYDPLLFEFVNDVNNDQTSEIERMNAVLVEMTDDPRTKLKAGFKDAGQAILNLELVATLAKPPGFYDPKNPAEVPPIMPKKSKENDTGTATDKDKASTSKGNPKKDKPSKRRSLLSFSNTDMAFSGDKLVVGSYHGFNVYQLQENGIPKLFSSIVCPGGQGDVSIVGDLLIMSVQETRGRVDCGLEGISKDVSEERFRGLRIFDISDLARPIQVGQVQTCRGSHTHSVVSGPGKDGKIIVYNSGTSSVRDAEELEDCVGKVYGDERTALFRIDVIEIPVDDPSKARIIDSPAVFADEKSGRLSGLWQGGDHGDDTQKTRATDQCHDITVFPELNIAAGACSGNGILFDISNPLKPKRIDVVMDKGFAYWHSATFNNDGTKVIFTDEWGGGSRPRCRAYDPKNWGADAIYDIVDGKLIFRSHYKLPAPQLEQENCVAHNGSIVPVPGRDIFAQAWYQGGLSLMDFTDSTNPHEIAYFDRGPIHEEILVLGGYWSTYWYNGKIYASEIARGLDVFALVASEYLSENEIAAAKLANMKQGFNPQQQFQVTWPAEPVVARAYLDQLQRSASLSDAKLTQLNDLMDQADQKLEQKQKDSALSKLIISAVSKLGKSSDPTSSKRLYALTDTLKNIAARLK